SRGTLHVHCVLWADLLPERTADDLCGRTGKMHHSEFVRLLEDIFRSRADVQCGDGSHNLLQYVAGYVSKASDALSFCHPQAQRDGTVEEQSKWRQTYRLLCKRSPMEQEIVMEFAGLPMVKHSFSGVALFAPIPGSKARNTSRDQYLVYQFFLRQAADILGCAGPMKNMSCGIAISFPFELLDIFVGAWAATFLPDVLEHRLHPEVEEDGRHYGQEHMAEQKRRASFAAPEGFKHLKAVLCLDRFQLYRRDPLVFHPNVGELLALMERDLILRGLTADRIATFKARIHACTLLLCAFRDGQEDPSLWTARSVSAPPARIWSQEQQEVLNHVQRGTSISDAADMETSRRVLQVAGGPGTGKTEVIIAAVRRALEDGCRVLIAGPIGLLVSMYRLRLPHPQNLTMETLHSAFRITRDADAAYIPPRRLRHYDLIVVDEVSQIDAFVWCKLKTALGELRPCPFVVFVGDFQQLQPLQGGPELQNALERQRQDNQILYVKLEHHEAARSVDPAMLDFLEAARLEQPFRGALVDFFRDRILPADPSAATRAALNLEARTDEHFPDGGIPADVDRVALAAGMRSMLRSDVFLLHSDQGLPILVHPVTQKGRKFLPVTYGWATTMRRAQGVTLEKVGLWFDRMLPDRGYAYVGLSRAKRRADVFLMGKIRRTDWRPVGGEGRPGEQTELSALSESSNGSDVSSFGSQMTEAHQAAISLSMERRRQARPASLASTVNRRSPMLPALPPAVDSAPPHRLEALLDLRRRPEGFLQSSAGSSLGAFRARHHAAFELSKARGMWPLLLLIGVVFSQRRQLKKMVELPRKTRVVWSGCLWAFLSTMTVFDTSGNAIGYPVFFGFVLTYMRDRNGVIAGDWRESLATFFLVGAAVFAGVWIASIPSHLLPVRRSWKVVVWLQQLQSFSICLLLWLVTLFFRVYRRMG
ncbi:unnamed protein product, partial [Symbiodinium sp. KB8]